MGALAAVKKASAVEEQARGAAETLLRPVLPLALHTSLNTVLGVDLMNTVRARDMIRDRREPHNAGRS